MAEPSQEELIEIANNFLLNSPPGEFMEVEQMLEVCFQMNR